MPMKHHRCVVTRRTDPAHRSGWAKWHPSTVGGQFVTVALIVLIVFGTVWAGVSFLLHAISGGGWFMV